MDKNPLAVEMAKLSPWLLTLAKDKPFEFLNHAIRCGDSLIGISDLDQLKHFNLDPSQGRNLFTGPIFNVVDEAVALRQKIEAMPSNTVEDVEAQEKLLADAEEKTARLRCAADLLLSVEFQGVSAADKQSLHDSMVIQAGHYVENDTIEDFRQVVRKALKGQHTFHWPLEFPEVFQKRGGFDAFVYNPPFMGGTTISGRPGKALLTFLTLHYSSRLKSGGRADLCAYFVVGMNTLLRQPGCLGLITTNTISQGDTPEVGLDTLLGNGSQLIRAVGTKKWPGTASLEVSQLWLQKGAWRGQRMLDEQPVRAIDALLTSHDGATAAPIRLAENRGNACEGSKEPSKNNFG